MKTETVNWRELPDDGMPDAETTVLAEVRNVDDDGTKVWPAFWSGARWVDCASGWIIDTARVVAWTDQPGGTAA